MYMLGAYVSFFLITVMGLASGRPWLPPFSWPCRGVMVDRLSFVPCVTCRHVNSFISAIGALIVLENGVMAIWGPQGQAHSQSLSRIVELLGITMTEQRLLSSW